MSWIRPGGTTALGFYEGYTSGGTTPSITVAAFTLTGLPGNISSSSCFGGFQSFFIDVAQSPLACSADGQVGCSWNFQGPGPSSRALPAARGFGT